MGKTYRDKYNNSNSNSNAWSPDYEVRNSIARLSQSDLEDLWKGYYK